MGLSQRVQEAGRDVRVAAAPALPDALSRFLATFVGQPYGITKSALRGPAGQQTDPFTCIVFPSSDAAAPVSDPVPAGEAAAVIDGHEDLSVAALRAAYTRIGAAKRLHGSSPRPCKETGERDELLGVVLGLRSDLTLETIAEEMRRLNEQAPAPEWPDIVVVADTGVVQYSVQFPGENLLADFFLPNAAHSQPAPMYVVMCMKPTGDQTLNRMLAFVVAHLAAFAPGADVPPFQEITEGFPNTCVSMTGYQFKSDGTLVPVPREYYNDRYLAPLPFTIEDDRGHALAAVQFLPWQDGSVIRTSGQLPLQMLLVFLAPEAIETSVVQRPNGQLSYVIPLTEVDFRRGLARFQRRSNMVVRPDETSWVVKKFADEGSSSPFIARLLIGVLKLRDAALPQGAERKGFDDAYESVMTPLFDARTRVNRIATLWERHARRVQTGDAAGLRGRAIHVDENVDRELGDEVNAFIGAATRAVKTGMQAVAAQLETDVGFLFQKEAHFGKHLRLLATTDPALADYLLSVRLGWSKMLISQRNAIEHEGWQLPKVEYQRSGNGVRASEPAIEGLPVTAYTAWMLDRVSIFVEEVTAHLLQKRLIADIAISEVPLAARSEESPERFRITLAVGGLPPWEIAYRGAGFEDT